MVLSLFGGFAWAWPAIGTPPIMRPKLGHICFPEIKELPCDTARESSSGVYK